MPIAKSKKLDRPPALRSSIPWGLRCPNGLRMKARRGEIAFSNFFGHSKSQLRQSSIPALATSALPPLAVVASTR